jgi:hypothetical protein
VLAFLAQLCRSRGNRIARFSAPLADLLASAGMSTAGQDGTGTSKLPYYDPNNWPHGELTVKV